MLNLIHISAILNSFRTISNVIILIMSKTVHKNRFSSVKINQQRSYIVATIAICKRLHVLNFVFVSKFCNSLIIRQNICCSGRAYSDVPNEYPRHCRSFLINDHKYVLLANKKWKSEQENEKEKKKKEITISPLWILLLCKRKQTTDIEWKRVN